MVLGLGPLCISVSENVHLALAVLINMVGINGGTGTQKPDFGCRGEISWNNAFLLFAKLLSYLMIFQSGGC